MAERVRATKPGWWAAYLMAGFVIVAPQLLGGATESTQLAILTVGAAVATCCAITVRGSNEALGFVPWAFWAALVAALWTLLQAVPLPCSWVEWAQPER